MSCGGVVVKEVERNRAGLAGIQEFGHIDVGKEIARANQIGHRPTRVELRERQRECGRGNRLASRDERRVIGVRLNVEIPHRGLVDPVAGHDIHLRVGEDQEVAVLNVLVKHLRRRVTPDRLGVHRQIRIRGQIQRRVRQLQQ